MSAPPPMACVEFVERVNDYLQGVIAADDRARLEEHLAVCPHCVDYLDQIRAVRDQAPAVADEDIPEHVRDDLVRAFTRWRDEHLSPGD